eukprot:TRINITY_DN76971_c0_g1_i1.p1 TRINITY_DN76971_c0_g1~~TRINITY_DN76971_c0_g1_i1.p1  ORF type:complete len:285 (-),score=79.85 TRINITY_DN76971_c0_g1_i1:113-856(-)
MMSAASDPYYVAKDDVESALKKLKKMHGEWKSLLTSENTAKSKQFQVLHEDIVGELKQLEYDFQDIAATISMVEENRAKFQFDDAEIARRKDFVRTSRSVVKEISDSVAQAQAKINNDRRELLTSQQNANRAAEEQRNRAYRDNQDALERQRQEQVQIVATQDEALNELSKSAQRLGETARVINVELHQQAQMLEELDEDIDRDIEKLNFVMKRMGRLLKTGDSKQLCLIVALGALFVVLLFLVINT